MEREPKGDSEVGLEERGKERDAEGQLVNMGKGNLGI